MGAAFERYESALVNNERGSTDIIGQLKEDMEQSSHRSSILIVLITAALVVAGCATAPTSSRIDNIPMYGQPAIPRPDLLRQADEDFIKKASAGFDGSREKASKAWYAEGDRFLRELNLDFAMRRFNQAWLLDPNNYEPYWGFARVLLETDRLNESIQHFETAKRLCDDNYQRVALLSDSGVAYSFAGNFQHANEQFRESTALDSTYANAWLRWAESLHREGNYSDAWNKLKQARGLGAKVSDAFLRSLSQKMPEPQ